MNLHYEVIENIFEFRPLKKLADQLYCEKFLFFLSHSLGKIFEHDKQAETYFDNIAQIIKESTDKYFSLKQMKRRAPKKLWITNNQKTHSH